MSSSTTGDRRWGTARRSGMTILGKVAVPKPINLPSQRLENQGLDPNVEIVPKGTLSWGSKSSLNAWGTSSLSPRTESGPGSPSHLSNRPSTGGSVTRPSTADSDKAHDSSSIAWDSNSRPSSASGVFPSNQASAALQHIVQTQGLVAPTFPDLLNPCQRLLQHGVNIDCTALLVGWIEASGGSKGVDSAIC